MNTTSSAADRLWNKQLIVVTGIAVAVYCLYYFVFCGLPIIGTPTFRIDYFVTTVTRTDGGLMQYIIHSRPISELYVYLQTILAKIFFDGQAKYIIYPLQHISIIVYFISISKVVESIFKVRIHVITFLAAWVLLITNPGLIGGVYKLETIVGTISMFFGGLALIALSLWDRNRKSSTAAIFVLLYALSIFAKEDFILPPIFLLGWYIYRDVEWKKKLYAHRWLLSSTALLLIFFVAFNKLIIPGRSFIDPIEHAKSPYFMTLNPFSMAKVALLYFLDEGRHIRVLSVFYVTTTLASLVFLKKWKETLLIALIIGGLMAPYLIMPNHMFPYYAIKWWVWQTIFSLLFIQIIFVKKEAIVVTLIGVAALAPALINLTRHKGITWNQSAYFRDRFTKSENVQKTLLNNRQLINAQKQVAVVGIGAGEIEQSPWQGNGQTAFFLRGDFGLNPKWIVFVRTSDPSYVVSDESPMDLDRAPEVMVKSIDEIDRYKHIPRLVFGSDGNGEFIESQAVDDQKN